MNLTKIIGIVLFATFISFKSNAQGVSSKVKKEIKQQIDNLRTAHLKRDATLADKLYHQNLILTSQSGKKYNKEIALINIKNTFESYENSDIEFLQITDDVILTNYLNERKYKGFEKGKFRLTVVWTKYKDTWRIISMQSSKIKKK